jgi:hypothetical protein
MSIRISAGHAPFTGYRAESELRRAEAVCVLPGFLGSRRLRAERSSEFPLIGLLSFIATRNIC